MALRGAFQPARLALHRQGVTLDEILDKTVVAQLVGGLVQRVDGAVGEAEDEEGHQDEDD